MSQSIGPGGITCFAIFNLIGSSVDEKGMLHEPFGLLPIGFLLLFLGGLLSLVALLRLIINKRRTGSNA
ncbi:DUF3955 domain-containing protein [Shewanella sp. 1180_01]|uniref:DUF3955 domain-containing protein n=1 Tax=Shewanella sp. 1180_01 TaxID=2604451 RepID=UPI0040645E4A